MKIVFLAPFGIRPKGTVIARMLPLAVELQNRGHSVTIIAPPYTNPEDSGKSEVVEGVLLRNIRLGPRHKALAAPFLALRMFREAMRERPDIVHLFKPKGYGGIAAMIHLALIRMGMHLPPLFIDTDDWEGKGGMNELHDYSSIEKRFYRFQEKWLSLASDGVSAASRELEQMTIGLGVAPKRLLYLPNCVFDSKKGDGYIVRKQLGIPEDAPVLLLYTRFFEFEQKRLYRILTEIRRHVPTLRFLVIGKGRNNEESALLEASLTGGFNDSIVMAGWVQPKDIPEYLTAANVAIYPLDDTLINRCKCPAKLTEILISGVAVVADRVGQAKEYIKHEFSGILCDPTDWREMARASVSLLNDRVRSSLLGNNGHQYLIDNFSWKSYAEKLEKFYSEYSDR